MLCFRAEISFRGGVGMGEVGRRVIKKSINQKEWRKRRGLPWKAPKTAPPWGSDGELATGVGLCSAPCSPETQEHQEGQEACRDLRAHTSMLRETQRLCHHPGAQGDSGRGRERGWGV